MLSGWRFIPLRASLLDEVDDGRFFRFAASKYAFRPKTAAATGVLRKNLIRMFVTCLRSHDPTLILVFSEAL